MKGIDRFQIATSLLFVVLGSAILIRGAASQTSWLLWGVSLGFVGLGSYRLFKVYKYLTRPKE